MAGLAIMAVRLWYLNFKWNTMRYNRAGTWTPSAGRVMIIFGFSLDGVSNRIDLGNLLTLHGIWRLLATVIHTSSVVFLFFIEWICLITSAFFLIDLLSTFSINSL